MKFTTWASFIILCQAVVLAEDYTVKDGPEQVTISTPISKRAFAGRGTSAEFTARRFLTGKPDFVMRDTGWT